MTNFRRSVLVALALLGAIIFVAEPAHADVPNDGSSYKAIFRHSGLGLDAPNIGGNGGNYTQNGADEFALVATCGGCSGYYVVNSVGKCMTVTGASTANGAAINQYTCTAGAANQWWFMDARAGGFYQMRVAHSGKCAEVVGASVTPGAEVRQYPCKGEPTHNPPWRSDVNQQLDLILLSP